MFVGHQKQWAMLLNALKNSKVPQALIFSGQEGLGKKQVAFEFVKRLNNRDLSFPDLIFIEPKTKEIHIDQIRDLQQGLALRSTVDFRAVILDNAHTLNHLAQNCFLKTLEEPKSNIVFILVTHLPHVLLKTIRSRCQELKFFPLPKQEIQSAFQLQKSQVHFDEAMDWASGRPGVAFEALEKQEWVAEKQAIFKEIQALFLGELWERFAFAKRFFSQGDGNEKLVPFLDNIIEFLRAGLLKCLGVFGEQDRARCSCQKLVQIIREVEALKFLAITTNINQRLGFEALMLKI